MRSNRTMEKLVAGGASGRIATAGANFIALLTAVVAPIIAAPSAIAEATHASAYPNRNVISGKRKYLPYRSIIHHDNRTR